jgi:hypothetical protein
MFLTAEAELSITFTLLQNYKLDKKIKFNEIDNIWIYLIFLMFLISEKS